MLSVAAASVDITPAAPVPLAGYVNRTDRFEAIHDRIEANIIVLRDGQSLVTIVSVDLLYPGAKLRELILSLVNGLRAEQLFLAASHTHFAPATSHDQPDLGRVDDGYLVTCARRIADSIMGLLEQHGEPVFISSAAAGPLPSVNRRLKLLRLVRRWPFVQSQIAMAPNLQGERDPNARVVSFVSRATEKVLCVLWNWSCHPVGFPNKLEISSDYPGVVRSALRRKHSSDLPVVFLQGFAGDIRPPIFEVQSLPRPGAFATWSVEEWQSWADKIALAVAGVPVRGLREENGITIARREFPLTEFVTQAAETRKVACHGIAFGRICIIGISAEPTVALIALLRTIVPSTMLLVPVGCIDATYGYLPTSKQVRCGGYEAAEFLRPFSLEGRLRDDIEARALRAFNEMVRTLYGDTQIPRAQDRQVIGR